MQLRVVICAVAAAAGLTGCGERPLSPLIRAARSGDLGEIRRLIDAGADPDQPSGINAWTPLLHAIHTNQYGSVAALLDEGADVNRAAPHGITPPMMAAGYGQTRIVELLLDRGADPYATTVHGITALDLAMLGTTDIDAFTALRCQTETVNAIRRRAPRLEPRGGAVDRLVLRLKSCPGY